jgi:chaperone required for assembly of F1-ATPase
MSGTGGVWAPRRFWTVARAEPAEGGHVVLLDARPLRTPARAPLLLPSRALAEAVAAEWDAQEGTVQPATMPLTRAANTAIDRVQPHRPAVEAEVAGYGETDLICYRAAAPEGLVAAQAAAWDPLLDWAAAALGAPLRPVAGVIHAPQPESSLAALRRAVAGFDDFGLVALHDMVALSGSLVIGLATAAGQEPPATLWERAHVDEAWQVAQWGEDAEAAAAMARRRAEFLQAVRFLALARAAG